MNRPLSSTSRDIEQASELLDVTNEAGLEAFLGRLVDDAARQSGRRLATDNARKLVSVVKQTAVQTLPTLTTVFGTGGDPVSLPGRSPVATAARVYGLELEGLSAEDRDYEIARQIIRFTESAARHAATPSPALPAAAAVSAAVEGAAREFAPGLLLPEPPMAPSPSAGQWVRRGSTIVLDDLRPPEI